jgi:hypothetical protein
MHRYGQHLRIGEVYVFVALLDPVGDLFSAISGKRLRHEEFPKNLELFTQAAARPPPTRMIQTLMRNLC